MTELIKKKTLHAGRENAPEFLPNSRVKFHFTAQSILGISDGCLELGDMVDDSRTYQQPVEILIGKQFKLEVWETAIQTMAVGEVAEFRVDKTLCLPYPLVAKTLRDAFSHMKPKHQHDHQPSSHCCGALAMGNGPKLGYEDLNRLMEKPTDMLFIIELLSVDAPESFKKEVWQMNENEKLEALPKLKQEGNTLYQEKKISEATQLYAQAIGIIEQLQLKEKPGDEEWHSLAEMKIPFLLNYSQCQLLLGNYYDCIQQCTEVLLRQPDNVKALYRRGVAHLSAWNPIDAKNDFEKTVLVDPSLEKTVRQQLNKLEELKKQKNKSDRAWLSQAFGAT
nr:EOG090X09NR [Eurycercus lamellatus]